MILFTLRPSAQSDSGCPSQTGQQLFAGGIAEYKPARGRMDSPAGVFQSAKMQHQARLA